MLKRLTSLLQGVLRWVAGRRATPEPVAAAPDAEDDPFLLRRATSEDSEDELGEEELLAAIAGALGGLLGGSEDPDGLKAWLDAMAQNSFPEPTLQKDALGRLRLPPELLRDPKIAKLVTHLKTLQRVGGKDGKEKPALQKALPERTDEKTLFFSHQKEIGAFRYLVFRFVTLLNGKAVSIRQNTRRLGHTEEFRRLQKIMHDMYESARRLTAAHEIAERQRYEARVNALLQQQKPPRTRTLHLPPPHRGRGSRAA